MIWTLIGLLLLFWVLGLVFEIGGALINVLLVIALIVFIFNMITGRKRQLIISNKKDDSLGDRLFYLIYLN